jgi:hypothetical protein
VTSLISEAARTRLSVHIPRTHLSGVSVLRALASTIVFDFQSQLPKRSSCSAGNAPVPRLSNSFSSFLSLQGLHLSPERDVRGESNLHFARATGLLPPADVFTPARTEDQRSTRYKTLSFPTPSASSRAPIRLASPSSVTISSDVILSNSTDARCAGPNSALRMRVSRSGLRRTSARRHQAM